MADACAKSGEAVRLRAMPIPAESRFGKMMVVLGGVVGGLGLGDRRAACGW